MSDNNSESIPQQSIHTGVQGEVISVKDIFSSVWEGRWLIITITLVASIIGGAYIILTPNKFLLSLEIPPILEKEYLEYRDLNSIEYTSLDTDKDSETINVNVDVNVSGMESDAGTAAESGIEADVDQGLFTVTRQQLLEYQIEEIRNRPAILEMIKNPDFLDKSILNSDIDYEKTVLDIAKSFKLLPPTPKEAKSRNLRQNWEIKYEGTNEEIALKVLDEILRSTNLNVQSYLKKSFNEKIALEKKKRRWLLQDIDRKIENLIFREKLKTTNRIKFLKEQLKIAKELEIKQNSLNQYSSQADKTVVINIHSDVPAYLRGYLAIDKEISLLSERTDHEAFIPELADLKARRNFIENNPVLEIAKETFDASPISGESFNASSANVTNADISYKKKPALILILSALLGGILGLFAILVRNLLKGKARDRG